MSDLLYGGYFVKETKAPAGFYLDDNAYYFEIVEDGKTVTVENEDVYKRQTPRRFTFEWILDSAYIAACFAAGG